MPNYTKETIRFLSADGKTQVAGYYYAPETPKAIIQISHGMCEYVERYEPMIDVLCGAGYAVCGNDHLGHGKSVQDEALLGMVDYGDHVNMLRDMNTLHKIMAKRYPGLPYFLFGHSMGSLLARIYCGAFGEELTGAVFCGTGQVPQQLLAFRDSVERIFDNLDPMESGSNLPLSLVTKLGSIGLKDGDDLAWLSRSHANIEAYRADPLCGFKASNALNRELVTLAVKASDPELPFKLPYGFPVMLIAGAKDPVGMNGKGVLAAADLLETAGILPEVILYPGDRHEILNEEDREKVYEDVAWFLQKVLDED